MEKKRPDSMLTVYFLLTMLLSVITVAVGVTASGSLGIGKLFIHEVKGQQSIIIPQKTDYEIERGNPLANVSYHGGRTIYKSMGEDGASPLNHKWETGLAEHWFIEEQRSAEDAIVWGVLNDDPKAVQTGLKMFDWGFNHQGADGSFVGTGDSFHSTSFFVAAVARSLLFIEQSPLAGRYTNEIEHYKPLLHRAALWMISAAVWERGIKGNDPYTHRRYLVAAAIGLTGKLTEDSELIEYSRRSIQDGLALQWKNGVNPEKGGYDSSYQSVGLVYAEEWLACFPNDPLAPKVSEMIEKGLRWEASRLVDDGEISSAGNTRTAGGEITRNGVVKTVSYGMFIRAFSFWGTMTNNPVWLDYAKRAALHQKWLK